LRSSEFFRQNQFRQWVDSPPAPYSKNLQPVFRPRRFAMSNPIKNIYRNSRIGELLPPLVILSLPKTITNCSMEIRCLRTVSFYITPFLMQAEFSEEGFLKKWRVCWAEV
jgi:hypothetical protein